MVTFPGNPTLERMKTLVDDLVQENGGWCWFQDPRLIVDQHETQILFATVANVDGPHGASVDGNIDVNRFDLRSEESSHVTLGNIPTRGRGDDHNVAALWQRPDGRFLAKYTGHNYGKGYNGNPKGTDTHLDHFYRISVHPHDATEWGPEQVFRWPSNDANGKSNAVTYANLHYLSEEGGEKGRLYNIGRASGQRWQIATSDDWGETWTYRGRITTPPEGGRGYSQGYMKFSDNGKDRIDFFTTEAHPRDYNNGLYHGYLQNGKSHRTDGTIVDEKVCSEGGPVPEQFTPVFLPQTQKPGCYHTAWAIELSRTEAGNLVGLFQTRFGDVNGPLHKKKPMPGTSYHRLFFAELVEGRWKTTELAKLGAGLLDSEEDYTGLGVIDRKDGNTLYISTPIDPRNDPRLPHHELFKGVRNTEDDWEWSEVTSDSEADNLRPQLAHLPDGTRRLFWVHGTYEHQTHYSTGILTRDL